MKRNSSLHREGILASWKTATLRLISLGVGNIARLLTLQRITLHTELSSLRTHLLHHLLVILVESVGLDDGLQVLRIRIAGGITGTGDSFRPALVVIGRELEAPCIATVLSEELGVVLIGSSHGVVLAKLLVGTVIGIDKIIATSRQPPLGSLDAKVVVAQLRQLTLPVAAFQDALSQGDRCGNAVSPHLFHGDSLVLFCVFCVLTHSQLSFQSVRLFFFILLLLR